MAGFHKEQLKEHKAFRNRNANLLVLFSLLAVVTAIVVFWWLKLTGITVTSEAFCGIDPHTHSEACYSAQLLCDEEHTHSDDCYQDRLVCTKIEHTHSSDCFPDKTVDTETAEDWKKTFENVSVGNSVADNLIEIATTQIGYSESTLNYELDEYAEKHGYTRYGEWYGNPYAQWNSLFVSFCLNYSNINHVEELLNASAEGMRLAWQQRGVYSQAEGYACAKGDVVFYDIDADGKADRTGIVVYRDEEQLRVIEGDVEGAVAMVTQREQATVLGYGQTSSLYAARHMVESQSEQPEATPEEQPDGSTPLTGQVNLYIPQKNATYALYNQEPLMTMSAAEEHDIIYTSHLEDEVVNVVIETITGVEIQNGDTIHIGETYNVFVEFSEINKGVKWTQFKYDEDGYLTYHIPENLEVIPFTEWHSISATTENGTREDVGEYFVDANGLLRVRFFDDKNGINFIDNYSNVDFTIEFSTTVANTQSGTSSEIIFNDKIRIDLDVDGGAEMEVQKTHGEYDGDHHTVEYTIQVTAKHGVITDLVLRDEIWDTPHYVLRDTIVVRDQNNQLLDPQPTISDHPNPEAEGSVVLSGFPEFTAGDVLFITYKTALYDDLELLHKNQVYLWNDVQVEGLDSDNNPVQAEDGVGVTINMEKMKKSGEQTLVSDGNGGYVPVIKWTVNINKSTTDLHGSVVIDTLGAGLEYYTGKKILIERWDENDVPMEPVELGWDQVTLNDTSMEFSLPEGHTFTITYYSTYEELQEGEKKEYTNTVEATLNGHRHESTHKTNVVGFTPYVQKSASGNDGKYAYFTIEAPVPAIIKDWGHFHLMDTASFWLNEGGVYVLNRPEAMEITAVTESGKTITFTPYQEGGPIENTYILQMPMVGDYGIEYHSFKIFFNTATETNESSKWILDEDATLKVTYKLPLSSTTGTEWFGPLQDERTLKDLLLEGHTLNNLVYLNFADGVNVDATALYEYTPKIRKQSTIQDDGVIDYTVTFNNANGNSNTGYLDWLAYNAWFTDTFDQRLEYVPESLVVTAYAPWHEGLWVAKFRYPGTAEGNRLNAHIDDFLLEEFNAAAEEGYGWCRAENFGKYIRTLSAGGQFVFTYQLKLKDEYLYTTDHAVLLLDNTAELLWNEDGSSGPATETTRFETGLIDKSVVQKDAKLDFTLHINANALDVLPGSDTLTIVDEMTENLSVYWDSIKLSYVNAAGEVVDFASEQSEYTYTVTYEPATNRLTFVVPDGVHILIDYTTLVTETGWVSVHNAVKIEGKANVTDAADAIFQVNEHSGDASGSLHSITLLKQDMLTNEPLPNAVFALYGPKGDPNAVPPPGTPQSIVTEGGITLKYIATYTTGADGTSRIATQYLAEGGPYALVELTAPEGYMLLDKPVYFYFYENDPNGVIQTVTTLIDIENVKNVTSIPETGGAGPYLPAIIGIVFMAAPVLYCLIRRKRERRLLGSPPVC